MTTISSHPSKLREKRVQDGVNSGQPVLYNRWALDMIAHAFVELVESDEVDSATTTFITAVANVARVGDLIQFVDGDNVGIFVTVASKPDEDKLFFGQDLVTAPQIGAAFNILRYRPSVISTQGGIQVSVVSNTAQQISAVQTEDIIPVTNGNTPLVGANPARIGGWVRNIDEVDIYVSFSNLATVGKPTKLRPGGSLSLGGDQYIYTGPVSAIHDDGANVRNVEVVEL